MKLLIITLLYQSINSILLYPQNQSCHFQLPCNAETILLACFRLPVTEVTAWRRHYKLDVHITLVPTRLEIWETWAWCENLDIIRNNYSLAWWQQSRKMENLTTIFMTSHTKFFPNLRNFFYKLGLWDQI
jgi:hypothetical protein